MNRRALVSLGGLALVGVVFSGMVAQKEAILRDGESVLLRLAPADPRSLIEGDYMSLRYAITTTRWWNRDAGQVVDATWPRDGLLVVKKDADGVGELVGRYEPGRRLEPGEVAIRYRRRDWNTRIGAEAYYFQEGQADRFAKARYGELRVSASGEAVLVGLCGEDRAPIVP